MMRDELIQTILERYERLLLDLKNNNNAGVDETPATPNADADIPGVNQNDYRDIINK
jgi:hypothetical protein